MAAFYSIFTQVKYTAEKSAALLPANPQEAALVPSVNGESWVYSKSTVKGQPSCNLPSHPIHLRIRLDCIAKVERHYYKGGIGGQVARFH
jgi:hypothetical protein